MVKKFSTRNRFRKIKFQIRVLRLLHLLLWNVNLLLIQIKFTVII